MKQHHAPLQTYELDALVGTWRRFGSTGPIYEIVAPGEAPVDGDLVMRIRVIETGEELDYRVSEIRDDPREG